MRSHQKRSKKPLIIAVVAGIVVVLAALVLFGYQRLEANKSEAETMRDTALKLSEEATSPQKNKSEHLRAVEKLAMLSPNVLCQTQWWNKWQVDINNRAKAANSRCGELKKQLRTLVSRAETTKQYIDAETKLLRVLQTIKIDSKDKNWQNLALTSVRSAAAAGNNTTVPDEAEPLKKELIKRLKAIETAWTRLNVASKKQDANQYLSAEATLTDSYAALAAITDTSDNVVKQLITSLKSASEQL